MIVTSTSRDVACMTDMIATLAQLKDGTQPNQPLVVEHTATTPPVSFYSDAARMALLFTENSTGSPSHFSTAAGRTIYTPPDSLLNNAVGLSTTLAQPLYYVTTVFDDGTSIDATYDNRRNLLFSSVVVSSQKNPPFATNDNICTVVPCGQKEVNSHQSDDYRYSIVDFDLRIQLNFVERKNMSELDSLKVLMNANNLIRDALYYDRYRNGNAALYNADINGTYVGNVSAIPSPDAIQGTLKVQCAFLALSTTY